MSRGSSHPPRSGSAFPSRSSSPDLPPLFSTGPLPPRQPSYKQYQAAILSPPLSSDHGATALGEGREIEEEDDGGWVVDPVITAWDARRRRPARDRSTQLAPQVLHVEHSRSSAAHRGAGQTPEYECEPSFLPSIPPDLAPLDVSASSVREQALPEAPALEPESGRGTGPPSGLLNSDARSRIEALIRNAPMPRAKHARAHASGPSGDAPTLMPAPFRAATDGDTVTGDRYTGPLDGPPYMRHRDDPNRMAVQGKQRWGPIHQVNADPENFQAASAPGHHDVSELHRSTAIAPYPALSPRLEPSQAPTGQVPELDLTSPPLSDGGWTKDSELKRWAQGVIPATPPREQSPTPSLSPAPAVVPDESDADDVRRPGSTPPPPLERVTLYVSDDGSEADTTLPTPDGKAKPIRAQYNETSTTEIEAVEPVNRSDRPQSPVRSQNSPSRRERQNSIAGTNLTGSRRGPPNQARREKSGAIWKRDPHPAFSTKFASRRILVTFPFAMRSDALKITVSDHLSRYGSIRMTWLHEPQGDNCEKVLVVFDDEDAIDACLSDPQHTQCLVRSGGHAGTHEVTIKITRAPMSLTTKTVYIKITGDRFDARSRSASPPHRFNKLDQRATQGPGRKRSRDDWFTRRLPEVIFIDSVPSRYKNLQHKTDFWARIRPQNVAFENIAGRAFMETGLHARPITELHLGRKVLEKHIIPNLCEYFAEIINIIPPTSAEQGWLVSVGGVKDAMNLMEEFSKIPGITVRWASEEDGFMKSYIDHDDSPKLELLEPSPMGRLEKHLGGQIPRDANLRGSPVITPNTTDPDTEPPTPTRSPEAAQGNALGVDVALATSPAARVNQLDGQTPSSPAKPEIKQQHTPLTPYEACDVDPYHPHLRRELVYLYKGRTLREDTSTDTPQYYDDAAVFVGRLSKEMETEESLFHRFSRYGQICAIEYNPSITIHTYATARILYRDKLAADRALKYEQGQTSFGSGIRVEKRRVLPSDVRRELRFVDTWGRAYSPSMVSQYSPPCEPMDPERPFVPPAALETPRPVVQSLPPTHALPPPMHGQWYTPYPPPPWLAPQADGTPPTGPLKASNAPPTLQDVYSQLAPILLAMGVAAHPPYQYGLHHRPPLPPIHQIPIPSSPPQTPGTAFQMPQACPPTHIPTSMPRHFTTLPMSPPPAALPRVDASFAAMQVPTPNTGDAATTPPANMAADESSSSSRCQMKLKEVRQVNGTTKYIYDQEDFRRYQEEIGGKAPRGMQGGRGEGINGAEVIHEIPIPFSPPHLAHDSASHLMAGVGGGQGSGSDGHPRRGHRRV